MNHSAPQQTNDGDGANKTYSGEFLKYFFLLLGVNIAAAAAGVLGDMGLLAALLINIAYVWFFSRMVGRAMQSIEKKNWWPLGLLVVIPLGFFVVYFIVRNHLKRTGKWGDDHAVLIIVLLLSFLVFVGFFASIVLFSLNDARSSARDTRRIADLRQVQLALEQYYNENDQYPDDASAGACDNAEAGGGVLATLGLTGAGDPGSTTYGYGADGTGQSYVLRATLENTSHSALDTDVDGTVLNCDCADASGYYCVQS